MLKVQVTYPSGGRTAIIDRMTSGPVMRVTPVITPEEILTLRETVRRIFVDERIKQYIVDLVLATRDRRTTA